MDWKNSIQSDDLDGKICITRVRHDLKKTKRNFKTTMFKMLKEVKEENKVKKKKSMKNDQADFEKNQVKILVIKEGGHFVGEENLNR